jgi:hypothetical protein
MENFLNINPPTSNSDKAQPIFRTLAHQELGFFKKIQQNIATSASVIISIQAQMPI